ncbi:MAG: Energy-coupling factor transporter transmembrane protein EcfT [Methanomassiliicoccales archaeon PtaU1.Bin124]|nr:MAG: Energy-coupling factor transporter transmembrane protein EcfT [Methanomassiliicoccales archaeon PtaU1.Bin124]
MMGIDELAYQSRLKDLPPLGKFILALSLLVIALTVTSFLVPIITFSIGLALLLYSTGGRFPRIVLIAILDSLAIIIIGCVLIAFLTQGGGSVVQLDLLGLKLSLQREGLNLATLVLLRALAGIFVMLAFITSTPVPHFALALKQLHVPKEVLELTVLIYRYSFLLLEQMEVMTIAAACRLGFRGLRNQVKTTSRIAVGLFSRSLEMAERSQIALQCRNYQGDFPVFRPPRKLTWSWVLGPIALAAAIYVGNILLEGSFYLRW